MKRRLAERLFRQGFPTFEATSGGFWLQEQSPILRGFSLEFPGSDTALFRFYALLQPLYRFTRHIHLAYTLQICPDTLYRNYDDDEIALAIDETINKAYGAGINFLQNGANVESLIALIKANPLLSGDPNRLSDLAHSYLWIGNRQEADRILRHWVSTWKNARYEWVRNIAQDAETLLNLREAGEDIKKILEDNCIRSRKAFGLS